MIKKFNQFILESSEDDKKILSLLKSSDDSNIILALSLVKHQNLNLDDILSEYLEQFIIDIDSVKKDVSKGDFEKIYIDYFSDDILNKDLQIYFKIKTERYSDLISLKGDFYVQFFSRIDWDGDSYKKMYSYNELIQKLEFLVYSWNRNIQNGVKNILFKNCKKIMEDL